MAVFAIAASNSIIQLPEEGTFKSTIDSKFPVRGSSDTDSKYFPEEPSFIKFGVIFRKYG